MKQSKELAFEFTATHDLNILSIDRILRKL